jgi:hypothetical protein
MKINYTLGIFDSIDITNSYKRTITLTLNEQRELIKWFKENKKELLE